MPDACFAYGCSITAAPQKGIGLKKKIPFWDDMRVESNKRRRIWLPWNTFPFPFHTSRQDKREDKSLRLVAMVAKFPEDHKPKTSLKKWIRTVSNFNDVIQFHLTFQMLAKFSGVESERTVSKVRKRKRKFCVGFTYSTKQARVIRKFHVAVVQRRLRDVHLKTAWCTCKVVVLLAFFRSHCRRSRRYLNFLSLVCNHVTRRPCWGSIQ